MNYAEVGKNSRKWLLGAAVLVLLGFGIWHGRLYWYNSREHALWHLKDAGWQYVKLGSLDARACRDFIGWPPIDINAIGEEERFGVRDNKRGRICWRSDGKPKITWDRD